jgi:hypothetical protein
MTRIEQKRVMMRRLRAVAPWAVAFGSSFLSMPAIAACTVPNTLSGGQMADASEVMDNFNAVATCADVAVTPTGIPTSGQIATFSGPKTVTGGNLSGDVTTSGSTATPLTNTGVTPGTYVHSTITVDAKGRVTNAGSGSVGGGTVLYDISMGVPTISSMTTVGSTGNFAFTENSGKGVNVKIHTSVGGTPTLAGFRKAVPGSSFHVAVLALHTSIGKRWFGPTIGVYNSANGRFHTFGALFLDNNSPFFSVATWSASNVRVGTSDDANVRFNERTFWLHVKSDGTNLQFGVSVDGANPVFYATKIYPIMSVQSQIYFSVNSTKVTPTGMISTLRS